MKYCRFLLNDRIRYGTVEDLAGDMRISGPAPAPAEDLIYRLALEQVEIADFDFEPMPLNSAELLPPVTPSEIVCVGRNDRELVLEVGNERPAEPMLFCKAPSSRLEPGGTVRLSELSERVNF